MSTAFKLIKVSSGLAVGMTTACFGSAVFFRPIPKDDDKDTKHDYLSSRNLADYADHTPSIPILIARQVSIFLTVCLGRMFLMGTGKFRIVEDENYRNFVEKALSRSKSVGMVTVSNHRSMFDDPPIIACILPFWSNVKPEIMRWGICSQEYCFNDKLPAIIKAYIGSGKILPIKRGGGIDQKLLLDFARKLSNGDWCHLFPEAGVWQLSTLGGRSNGTEKEKGRLKWGVGKMIAHAPEPPVVIPFCHMGMERVMPQDPETRVTLTPLPIPGRHDVTVLFGPEITFEDLVLEHERNHGTLRKCHANCSADGGNIKDFLSYWASTDAEKILYHKITLRIEDEMNKLIVDLQQDDIRFRR